jgi:hypothetical protein
LLFLATIPFTAFFSDPHPGYKSKRIFLSAYLLRFRGQWRGIQPVTDAT